jgi:hypothetical protein
MSQKRQHKTINESITSTEIGHAGAHYFVDQQQVAGEHVSANTRTCMRCVCARAYADDTMFFFTM